MASELIQIYYREEQKASCFPFARLYFNDSLTIFFENSCLEELALASTADKIAVASWKLKEKLRWNVHKRVELTQELLDRDYDVLSFTKNMKHHGMLYAADRWHLGFRHAMTKIVQSIGKVMPSEVKIPIYQNHFSAKREIYQDYVKNYLSPAMGVMKNDPEIHAMVTVDSNYAVLDKKNAVSSEYLMDKIGLPYYPLAPFLLERLFSIYVHNHKINVTWL